MVKTGLVSVTFRKFSVEEIIDITAQAGLDGIEWGGDVHVPSTDLENAAYVGRITRDKGLEVISYGSYYRVGVSNDFDAVLETAVALGTQNIRVWAGNVGSNDADPNTRERIILDGKQISAKALEKNITISYEYHGRTLTDTHFSALKLIEEIDSPNTFLYWQPLLNGDVKTHLTQLNSLIGIDKLKNIHVYHWQDSERLPLSVGTHEWAKYLGVEGIKDSLEVHYAIMEFVRDESKEQFLADAKVLKELIL